MEEAINIIEKSEECLQEIYKQIDNLCFFWSKRILESFKANHISETHFQGTTGYGFNDIGRDVIDKVFATVLGAEDALVRNQIISGSHALNICLFALLRPGDTLLSISGKPYDSLEEVIGIIPNDSSLMSFGINYEQIDLVDNDFDYDKIEETLKTKKIKVIEIQRSKGYSTRKSLVIDKVEKVIKFIKSIDKDVIIMVDDCYCELVSYKSSIEAGADVMVASLMKNLGGGITRTGAYIAGRHDLIELCAARATLPGEGRDIGPTFSYNRDFLQGLYMAPSAVAASLKTSILTSKVLSDLGYKVEPMYDEERADIVQNITFEDPDLLVKYVQGIQIGSPIDSDCIPVPAPIAGYADDIIMASGAFTQGSTIEFSCDGPVRPPYIAYQQGSLTYEYGKLGLTYAIARMLEK